MTEHDLALEIGVSRTPVREALRRLGAEGLVSFTSSQRASVATWRDEDVSELFTTRALLEGQAASIAALRISPEQIAELESWAARMEQAAARQPAGYVDTISQANSAFHKLILDASAAKRLSQALVGLIEVPIVLRTFHRYDGHEMQRSMVHHRELIDSFKARDGDWARSVMQAHIYAARAAYLRQL